MKRTALQRRLSATLNCQGTLPLSTLRKHVTVNTREARHSQHSGSTSLSTLRKHVTLNNREAHHSQQSKSMSLSTIGKHVIPQQLREKHAMKSIALDSAAARAGSITHSDYTLALQATSVLSFRDYTLVYKCKFRPSFHACCLQVMVALSRSMLAFPCLASDAQIRTENTECFREDNFKHVRPVWESALPTLLYANLSSNHPSLPNPLKCSPADVAPQHLIARKM